jgi:hypothetical protein
MFMTKVCLKSNLRDELVQLKSLTRILTVIIYCPENFIINNNFIKKSFPSNRIPILVFDNRTFNRVLVAIPKHIIVNALSRDRIIYPLPGMYWTILLGELSQTL